MSTINVIKDFKGCGIYSPNRKAVAHRITPSTDNVIKGSQSTSSVPVDATNESTSSTSQQGNAISPSTLIEEELSPNAMIIFPYKDLKTAILSEISPKSYNNVHYKFKIET